MVTQQQRNMNMIRLSKKNLELKLLVRYLIKVLEHTFGMIKLNKSETPINQLKSLRDYLIRILDQPELEQFRNNTILKTARNTYYLKYGDVYGIISKHHYVNTDEPDKNILIMAVEEVEQ